MTETKADNERFGVAKSADDQSPRAHATPRPTPLLEGITDGEKNKAGRGERDKLVALARVEVDRGDSIVGGQAGVKSPPVNTSQTAS